MKYRKSPLQLEKLRRIQSFKDPTFTLPYPENTPFSKDDLSDLEQQFKGKIVYPGTKAYATDREEFDPVYGSFPLLIMDPALYADVRVALLSFALANRIRPDHRTMRG